MGVMACDRSGCEHIMCVRLFDGSSYICDTCWNELMALVKLKWPERLPPGEVKKRIEDFLNSEVGTYAELVDVDKEIDRLVQKC